MEQTFDHAAEERLKSALDAPEPTTWRPDDPEEGHASLLIGELVAVTQGTTAWGPRQIAILKDAEGGLWNVWLLHKVLIDEFLRQQPKIGEMLAIRWDGTVSPEQGQPYEKYRLIVDRPGGNVEWRSADPVAPAPAPAPAAPAPVTPAAAAAEPTVCDDCGFANGHHANGCPAAPPTDDIPF